MDNSNKDRESYDSHTIFSAAGKFKYSTLDPFSVLRARAITLTISSASDSSWGSHLESSIHIYVTQSRIYVLQEFTDWRIGFETGAFFYLSNFFSYVIPNGKRQKIDIIENAQPQESWCKLSPVAENI